MSDLTRRNTPLPSLTAEDILLAAIKANPDCTAGQFGRNAVFETGCGPSGDPELLALLRADGAGGYWYGHIRRNPTAIGYVALLVNMEVFVNAPSIPLLFDRFDYWACKRARYEPCIVQAPGDAYAEADTYEAAVAALARIVSRFDLAVCDPPEEAYSRALSLELRIVNILGNSLGDANTSPDDKDIPTPPGSLL